MPITPDFPNLAKPKTYRNEPTNYRNAVLAQRVEASSPSGGITKPVTPLQDYLSGEVEVLIDGKIRLGREENATLYLPKTRFVEGTSCQWHALVPIDCMWMHSGPGPIPPPKYPDADLFRFVKDCKAVGGAVTLNVGIYQEGHMAPASVAQLGRLAAGLKSP